MKSPYMNAPPLLVTPLHPIGSFSRPLSVSNTMTAWDLRGKCLGFINAFHKMQTNINMQTQPVLVVATRRTIAAKAPLVSNKGGKKNAVPPPPPPPPILGKVVLKLSNYSDFNEEGRFQVVNCFKYQHRNGSEETSVPAVEAACSFPPERQHSAPNGQFEMRSALDFIWEKPKV